MNNFFTGDTHLGHANIIMYSGRPYAQPTDFDMISVDGVERKVWASYLIKRKCADQMTDDLITKHNTKVNPEDTVWHVGDYAFGQTGQVLSYLRRMNGNFNFVWGNHDDTLKQVASIIHLYPDLRNRVKFLGDYAEIRVEGQDIVLMHYAMRVWNGSHKGVWQLYGHSHGSLPDDPNARSFDVGVDCHNYAPISFAEVKAIIGKKTFKPIDHHKERRG